ncbi:acyltransferase family protein [Galbitalea sp. SE-J8]|uniref:acyltransferase family protein n=1 Tax=Galbitalea sp. SE-J8 TaxID=3054952 RepID=UPI00259C727D|nr:acyltransferase family protein [Galbitalea sp. SE-J8]MDM4764162.1 acyltransferase family protein [Galbitalea sp. SE-J8]
MTDASAASVPTPGSRSDAAPATPAAPRKNRVPFWDNARFACVTLVVIGHAIQRMTYDSDNAQIVYFFIYAFHMPAFAMISGYFSKASPPGTRQMRKVLSDILLPYFVMEIIWTLVQWAFDVSDGISFNPTEPSWTLWFLLALGIFRLVLPYLVLIRLPLIWAVAFSVLVGYWPNVDSTFSLDRAIGILPFFLLGWQVRQWRVVDRWRVADRQAWWIRVIAAVVLAAWFATLTVFIDFWTSFDPTHWFFYDDSYRALGATTWWAGLVRLAFMALAVVLSAAFFVLIPRRRTWVTGLGQATMYVYLLHSFVLYPIRESGVLRGEHSSWPWLAGIIVFAIAISVLLASWPVRRVFRWLIEPKPRWLLRDLDEVDRATGRARDGSRTDPTGSRRR